MMALIKNIWKRRFLYEKVLLACSALQSRADKDLVVSISGQKYYHSGHYSQQEYNDTKDSSFKYGLYLGGLIGAAGCVVILTQSEVEAESTGDSENDVNLDAYGAKKKGLPIYTMEEVSQHDSVEKQIWVTYRHGVYDITGAIPFHPDKKILLGAGGDLEPFWALYAIHKSKFVLDLLEKHRIGNLADSDVYTQSDENDDPYCDEPRQHVTLKPHLKKPFNAEPPLCMLADSFITPNELFYVRNHLPVPLVDPSTYELEIAGDFVQEQTFTLDDLKKLPKHSVTATLQGAAHRRAEMAKVNPIVGISWGAAKIGNAVWSGARLCDVLRKAGFTEDVKKYLYIQFEGLDIDAAGDPYGVSIPLERVMDPHNDVLLVYEMNGEPLPRDHGYPVRVIIPGVVGSRSVKWLGRIVVSEMESDTYWQQKDYKIFGPNDCLDTVDFRKLPDIEEVPVTSAICEPEEGKFVGVVDGHINVKGYAYSGGGRKIIRVDLSVDGGQTWQEAENLESDNSRHPRAWAWTLWSSRLPVPKGTREVELVVKAVDSQYNTQPEYFKDIWNVKGYLANAYHRVRVKLRW